MGQQVKNLLRAQAKYGLMGSSAKTGKKFSAGHRSSFSIKLSFGIGHPPPIYQMQCICVGEGSRVPNLQMEFNYLDLFKSYGIFSDFVVPTWSLWFPHHPHHPHVIPISPRRSPCGPQGCGLHGLHPCCPRHPHIIPVIPTSSPHCLEGPQIIPNPPDTHPTHPPDWVGGPRITKNAIRFELIEIF